MTQKTWNLCEDISIEARFTDHHTALLESRKVKSKIRSEDELDTATYRMDELQKDYVRAVWYEDGQSRAGHSRVCGCLFTHNHVKQHRQSTPGIHFAESFWK